MISGRGVTSQPLNVVVPADTPAQAFHRQRLITSARSRSSWRKRRECRPSQPAECPPLQPRFFSAMSHILCPISASVGRSCRASEGALPAERLMRRAWSNAHLRNLPCPKIVLDKAISWVESRNGKTLAAAHREAGNFVLGFNNPRYSWVNHHANMPGPHTLRPDHQG